MIISLRLISRLHSVIPGKCYRTMDEIFMKTFYGKVLIYFNKKFVYTFMLLLFTEFWL